MSLMLPISFVAGFLGGLSFDALGIPLPYLLGSLCACALLSLKGWCAPLPKPGLRLGQLTIGLALGLYFTAHVLDALANIMGWGLSRARLVRYLAWREQPLFSAVLGLMLIRVSLLLSLVAQMTWPIRPLRLVGVVTLSR
jgi:uncharacterized membrane protein AbrB (regulator of aidB expression)